MKSILPSQLYMDLLLTLGEISDDIPSYNLSFFVGKHRYVWLGLNSVWKFLGTVMKQKQETKTCE